mmetsp:Transcript_1543/g.3980  ORF Transcript_1543/g.3980 Transcript_1543/m.3980 type:complete len:222 (+) Transcript_1543:188-853(+)
MPICSRKLSSSLRPHPLGLPVQGRRSHGLLRWLPASASRGLGPRVGCGRSWWKRCAAGPHVRAVDTAAPPGQPVGSLHAAVAGRCAALLRSSGTGTLQCGGLRSGRKRALLLGPSLPLAAGGRRPPCGWRGSRILHWPLALLSGSLGRRCRFGGCPLPAAGARQGRTRRVLLLRKQRLLPRRRRTHPQQVPVAIQPALLLRGGGGVVARRQLGVVPHVADE